MAMMKGFVFKLLLSVGGVVLLDFSSMWSSSYQNALSKGFLVNFPFSFYIGAGLQALIMVVESPLSVFGSEGPLLSLSYLLHSGHGSSLCDHNLVGGIPSHATNV